MPEGNYSVGSAYVEIKPKVDGFGKETRDKLGPELDKAGKDGGTRLGDGLREGVSAKAVAIGNVISEAVIAAGRAASEALGQTIQQAFEGFARFEQLSGGVEILFGDNATQVLENAQRAFETAGMSANDYLTSVTGFSSSLINSLGGDTAEAARLADMAITDMSDNVNTFGTDMDMVMRAYQGFARGNFTMLDNLSLGFSGTREGMQQLLAKAEELSGVHYDISSLSDMFEAINVVQSSMGVTGKTASEAASTVEGSLASLGAAWQNWLTELGKGDGDIERTTEDLVQAFGHAAENVIPLMGRIITGMIRGLPDVIAEAAATLPEVLAEVFSEVFGEGVGEGFLQAMEGMGEMLAPIGDAFAEIGEVASTSFTMISEALAELSPYMQPLFDLLSLIAGVLVQVLGVIFQIIGSGIVAFISGVIATVGVLLAGIGQLVAFVSAAPGQIMSFFSGLDTTLSGIFESAASSIRGVFEGILDFFAGIPGQIVGFFSGIASDIGSAFSGIHLPSLHFEGSMNPVDWLTSGQLPQISFYAQGGIVDSAHLGVFGEAGPEALVPLSPQRLQPFGEAVKDAMGGGYGTMNVYVNGAKVNDNEAIEASFYQFMRELARLNTMGGLAYG